MSKLLCSAGGTYRNVDIYESYVVKQLVEDDDIEVNANEQEWEIWNEFPLEGLCPCLKYDGYSLTMKKADIILEDVETIRSELNEFWSGAPWRDNDSLYTKRFRRYNKLVKKYCYDADESELVGICYWAVKHGIRYKPLLKAVNVLLDNDRFCWDTHLGNIGVLDGRLVLIDYAEN